jgi:hypothetical protein
LSIFNSINPGITSKLLEIPKNSRKKSLKIVKTTDNSYSFSSKTKSSVILIDYYLRKESMADFLATLSRNPGM